MVDRNFVAKIADFHRLDGLDHSRRGSNDFANLWIAPECLALPSGASPKTGGRREQYVDLTLMGGALTTAADVYSFGVVCYECLSRLDPFDNMEVADALDGVRSGTLRLEAPMGCDLVVAGTMQECLRTDPVRRPPFAELERRFDAIDPDNIIPGGGIGNADPRLAWLRKTRKNSKLDSGDVSQSGHENCLGGSEALKEIIQSDKRPESAAAAFLSQSSTASFRQSRAIRTESIINDLFPEHVAAALMRGEKVPPERKEMVTMYFSGGASLKPRWEIVCEVGLVGGGWDGGNLSDKGVGTVAHRQGG